MHGLTCRDWESSTKSFCVASVWLSWLFREATCRRRSVTWRCSSATCCAIVPFSQDSCSSFCCCSCMNTFDFSWMEALLSSTWSGGGVTSSLHVEGALTSPQGWGCPSDVPSEQVPRALRKHDGSWPLLLPQPTSSFAACSLSRVSCKVCSSAVRGGQTHLLLHYYSSRCHSTVAVHCPPVFF